jgi:hypothetical protein
VGTEAIDTLRSDDGANIPGVKPVAAEESGEEEKVPESAVAAIDPAQYRAEGAYCLYGGHASEYKKFITPDGPILRCPEPEAAQNENCKGSKRRPKFQCPTYGLQNEDTGKTIKNALCIDKYGKQGLGGLTDRCAETLKDWIINSPPVRLNTKDYQAAMEQLKQGLDEFEKKRAGIYNLSFNEYCANKNLVNGGSQEKAGRQQSECEAIKSIKKVLDDPRVGVSTLVAERADEPAPSSSDTTGEGRSSDGAR